MQNHFSLSRFGRLFRKHTAEYFKAYSMSLVVLLGALSLFLGFAAYTTHALIAPQQQAVLYFIGLLAAGTIFTSNVFINLSDKKTAIAALTLPASHLEKFLLAWLYSFVIFFIIYTLAFYLIDAIVINIDNSRGQPRVLFNILNNEDEVNKIFFVYIFLHAVAIWGAVYFQKMHFIKTAFTLFLAIAAFALFNFVFMGALIGKDIQMAMPFGAMVVNEKADQYLHISSWDTHQRIIILTFILMAVALWLSSYMRLKEKQV
ncbi:MAG: hypothetical protein JWQ14_1823 [Adhaeribacter sp.]|nr:hypothetical protein [Adhaeribacter sp.]